VYISLPKLNAGCTKTVAVERRRVRPDGSTLYDMASLTKVIALTTLAMMAVE